ncbi:hypothetical protein SESBI_27791 [Sesbania bispinosa]|nr:hypothetical protein SESBI_27791 [Sesbania bispinosa]
MANKRERDKLKELLKQTENLVQDLQEELEMKDSMTVKELHNENYGSQDTCDHSFYDKELNEFSPEKHMDNSPRIECKESYDKKEEQSSESMSKIEAELEAELERLGLDMNASSLERKLSELVEGNLDHNMNANATHSDSCCSMDGDKGKENPWTAIDIGLASLPNFICLNFLVDPEFVADFAQGEALDAYNEAYEELIKINDSEENSPSGIHDGDHKEVSHSHALGVQHGGADGSVTCSTVNGGRLSRELSSSKVTMLEGQSSSIYELDGTGDESGDCDNELERQLIRQIVERTKKGSHLFQNAQRILYSMDEDEH